MLIGPKRYELARAFQWEYSHKRLKLAQLPGQLGVFLALVRVVRRTCAASIALLSPGVTRGRYRHSSLGATTRDSASNLRVYETEWGAETVAAPPSAAAAVPVEALPTHQVRPRIDDDAL